MRWIPIIFFGFSMIRCANVIPPEGGPKDTIPPILIRSLPDNNSKNFKGQKITLEFNELIQLRNAKEEVIITPTMGKNTKFTFKKNMVSIEPELKLDSATTYSIIFRDVIQDLNEGNPAEGLKLAFSTGKVIDSLRIFGRVYSLLEGIEMEKFNVAIYTADTFNISKHQPSYVARTDKKGRFEINNLKPGRYFIYSWEDKNKNLKVETNTERFGTITEQIEIPLNSDSIKIAVIKLDSRPLKLNSYRNISDYSIIRLNKSPTDYKISSKTYIKNHYGSTTSEIIAYPPEAFPDSTQVRLTAMDSIGNTIDSIFYISKTKSKPIKESFNAKILSAKYTSSSKSLRAEVNYTIPLKKILPDSVEITLDTVMFRRLSLEDFKIDTTRKRLTIEKAITISDSLLSKKPILTFKKGSLISMYDDSLKLTELKIIPKINKELATVTITCPNKNDNWVIEAVDEEYNTIQSLPYSKTVTFKGLDPINTKFRAYHDTNKNSKWDVNNPQGLKQPEPYIYYRNEKGQQSIPLRANWIVELEWRF